MVEGDWHERNANIKAHITALDISRVAKKLYY